MCYLIILGKLYANAVVMMLVLWFQEFRQVDHMEAICGEAHRDYDPKGSIFIGHGVDYCSKLSVDTVR